jgi:thiol:disulfide interchange protein/DsbC/DsbD-like thiol-disulfide interchange protein
MKIKSKKAVNIKNYFVLIFSFFAITAFPLFGLCQTSEGLNHAKISLISSYDKIQIPSENSQLTFPIGIHFEIEDGWHIYWKNSGESAYPTKVKFYASNGWQVSELSWPAPEYFIERSKITAYGYEKETVLLANVSSISNSSYEIKELEIEAEIEFLICKEICIPGKTTKNLKIPFAASQLSSQQASLIEKYKRLLPIPTQKLTQTEIPEFTIKYSQITTDKNYLSLEFLNLPNTIKAHNLESFFQVFPNASDNYKLLQGRISQRNNNPTILLPVEFSSKKESDKEIEVSGVLVISKDLFTNPTPQNDIAVDWSTSVATKFNNTKEALPDLQNAKLLTFRLHTNNEINKTPENHLQQQAVDIKISPTSFSQLVLMMFYALCGGLILNLMPCVFPVIGIKAMMLLEVSNKTKLTAKKSALFYTLGILSSMLGLGISVLILRTRSDIGWGFQFQYPEFVLVLLIIVFILALGFFDFYSIQLPFLNKAHNKLETMSYGYAKEYFDGILATALSTPCSAPMLGTALVFAFSKPPLILILIFFHIGLGLSLPYLILVANPKLLSFLPKPGKWMLLVRQGMGCLLLLTVFWLLFVFSSLTENGLYYGIAFLFSTLLIIALTKINSLKKPLVSIFNVALVLALIVEIYPRAVSKKLTNPELKNKKIAWEFFSEEKTKDALNKNRPVFIDFTADWCLTCKANEFLIIETPEVYQAFLNNNVMALKADWTRGDIQITNALKSFGAQGVPFYVVLLPNKPPILLPTIPQKSQIIDSFKQATD